MKKSNWVRQASTVLSCLTAIMFLMNLAPGIPVLAGEYDLSGSIEAAKKAEAELLEQARQAEYDAIMIVAEAYVKAYAKRGYDVTVDQVWELAIKYYERKSGETVLTANREP